MGLWASSRVPDLLTADQRKTTIDAAFALQQPDGGWSTTAIGSYKRTDNTQSDTRTDGYATALATLALQSQACRRLIRASAKGSTGCVETRIDPPADGSRCRRTRSAIRKRNRQSS